MTRLARFLVVAAARRWPAGLAETMAAEWLAEIEALRVEPGLSPLRRRAATALFSDARLLLAAAVAAVVPMSQRPVNEVLSAHSRAAAALSRARALGSAGLHLTK